MPAGMRSDALGRWVLGPRWLALWRVSLVAVLAVLLVVSGIASSLHGTEAKKRHGEPDRDLTPHNLKELVCAYGGACCANARVI